MNKARLVVGASSKNEDILWATKFFAPDEFVFLEAEGKKLMVVNSLEYDRARSEAKVDLVMQPGDFKEKKVALIKEQALALVSGFTASVAVSPDFPAEIYQYLLKNGIKVIFQDPLFPERAVKTEDEVEDIAYAQQAMEEAFRLLLNIIAEAEIREGKLWSGGDFITSEMLCLIFDTELMKRNCVCEETIIASGEQATDPHCLGFGPILANVPIVFDMFPRSRRKWYWSDMTRTVAKGKLTAEAEKMYQAVYWAQVRAEEMVKPGVDGCGIHDFVVQEFRKRGFKTGQVDGRWQGFFHNTGHGVGLEIHERPFISYRKRQTLEPGNVITIEPGLYYKGIGGVRIEDTICVTKNGYENLVSIPKTLIEIP